MNDLIFHPVLPWPLLGAVLLGILVLMGWTLVTGLRSPRRIVILSALRLVALAAVAFALVQPQRQHQEVTILRPQVAVLVDNSLSMTDPVDDAQPRRADRVKEFLASPAAAQARKDYDFRVFTLDEAEVPTGDTQVPFTANASNVVGSVAQVQEHFRGQPLAAILLLSDGLDTSGAARPEGIAYSVPVDTFELEKPFAPKPRPLRISIAGADFPPRVVTGWHSDIHVGVAGSGVSGQTVPVELWRNGRKIAETPVSFNEDEQTRQAGFQVTHERPGVEQYEVRVRDAAADKEARAYPFAIDVVEPGKRVLYIQNQLSFDYKFLHRAIVSNRNLQLTSYVRWADGRLVSLDDRGGQALNLSPPALAAYGVVILGDLAPDALPADAWRSLHDFVDHGGGLVLLGGPASFASPALAQTPLGKLLPVLGPSEFRQGSYPVQITDTGLHSPVFGPVFAQVKDFPPLLTCDVSPGAAPSAEVLMEAVVDGKAHPLVAATRFGKGRVVAVLTDTVWRWRLGAAAWRADKSPYDLFWAQLLDWLVPKEDAQQVANAVELFTERSSYVLGEKPEVRAVVHSANGKQPASLALKLKTPDDRTFDYTMRPTSLQTRDGRSVRGFAVPVEPNVTGIFRADAQGDAGSGKLDGTVRFVVTRPATEITGKPINRPLLQRVADLSKGHFYALGEWDGWRKDLHVEEQHFSRTELSDLWNGPVLLGVLMTALAVEWIVRKLWHLP